MDDKKWLYLEIIKYFLGYTIFLETVIPEIVQSCKHKPSLRKYKFGFLS